MIASTKTSLQKNVTALPYAFRYYSRSGCTTDTGKLPKFRAFSNGRTKERRKYSVFCDGVLINSEIRLFCCNCCRCCLGFLLWILRRKLRKKNGLHLSLKLTFNIFALQYFTGNNDQNTIVQYRLFPRIIARYVRIHPWGWYRHICMRVEFYGCRQGLLLFFNQIMFGHANYLVRHKRRNIVGFLRIPDRNKSTENVREKKKTKIAFFLNQSYWSRGVRGVPAARTWHVTS